MASTLRAHYMLPPRSSHNITQEPENQNCPRAPDVKESSLEREERRSISLLSFALLFLHFSTSDERYTARKMGCILSTDSTEDGGSQGPNLPGEVYVFLPGLRAPKPIELTEALQGFVTAELALRLASLRSQVIIASDPCAIKARGKRTPQGAAGANDLQKTLEDYLPALLGLVTGGEKLSSSVVFEWTNLEDEKKETALASAYYELLSVLHLLGMLALQEANTCLTPRPPADGYNPKVSEESKRTAIQTLLKAAAYFNCAISAVLPNTPEDIKAKLPADITEGMLNALRQQALGQGVELQLGFAVDNVKASLAVKRRLACEQVKVWEQANQVISSVPLSEGWGEKHLLFVKWKLAEAKAGAYYFHGLILDEGYEENTHAQALVCLKAADSYLKESQKARIDFGTAEPLTKVSPVWGPMKYLSEKIPREALSKGRIFRDNYRKEKTPSTTPELPDFSLALQADGFALPAVDLMWNEESGYEARPSVTPDVPSFLLKREHVQKQMASSDLRRAGPMSPPLIVTPEMVQAR